MSIPQSAIAEKIIAKKLKFNGIVQDPWGNTRAGFSASTKIDRQDFGLSWNNALEAGGLVVGNDVKINIEIELVKAQ